MSHIGYTKKFLAILLLLSLLGVRIGAVSYAGFVVPLQDFIAQTDFIADAESSPRMAHYKVKMQGFDVPVPCQSFVFIEKVYEARVDFPSAPEKDLPEGHVSIFIPPA